MFVFEGKAACQVVEDYKKDILLENFLGAIGYDYKEWLKVESENDPSFFSFLFDDSKIDGISDLNERQLDSWNKFIENVDGLCLEDYINHFQTDLEDESAIFPVRSKGDYFWVTVAEIEKMKDQKAFRVFYDDVTDEGRWEPRAGDIDMSQDYEWLHLEDGSYIGLW